MDEYIRREDAVDAIKSLPGTIPNGDPVINAICKALTERLVLAIEKIPAAQVAPIVRGTWVYNPGDNVPYCNQCAMPQDVPSDFCHSCGAEMG